MIKDRLSLVREVYHTSDDPQKVSRAWMLAEKIVRRRMDRAKKAAYARGDFRFPFGQVAA